MDEPKSMDELKAEADRRVKFRNPWGTAVDSDGAPVKYPEEMDREACAELAKKGCGTCIGRGTVMVARGQSYKGMRKGKTVDKYKPMKGPDAMKPSLAICSCVESRYNKLSAEKKISFWERHVGVEVS